MFTGATERRVKFRLEALLDQKPVSPSIGAIQREFITYIQSLMLILAAGPAGRALLSDAVEKKVSVGLDTLLEPSGNFFYPAQNHFDFGYQSELLHSTEKGRGRYLASFIGGLRRAWHHGRGYGADLRARPEDFLLQFRCEEADVEAVIHLAGWELRAAGHSCLWRHLLSGLNGDMAVIFERAVSENPHAQFNGGALKATFNQWFAEQSRTIACDRRGLELMDMAIVQPHIADAIGTRSVRAEELQRTGLLPGGHNYLSGCHFSGGWYGSPVDTCNRLHLQEIVRDIARCADSRAATGF